MKTDRDAPDYLTSPARISGYLDEAVTTGDPAAILLALGAIARAHGMTKVAKATGCHARTSTAHCRPDPVLTSQPSSASLTRWALR
jgi:probable addiction module antidote protein